MTLAGVAVARGRRVSMKRLTLCLVITFLLGVGRGYACVGTNCMEIWSTSAGGGTLAVQWDFANRPVQTFESFCTPDRSQCLYSTIDPGFMAPTVDEDPTDGFFRIDDGTSVTVEIVSADAAVSLHVNGQKLSQAGDSALLGTMPTIHNHPSWQIIVPGDQFGDYHISYKLKTDSPTYGESPVFTAIVTNTPPPVTPTSPVDPTATPTPCAGDCNGDGSVTVDELLACVNMALGTSESCPACDVSGDSQVTVDEILGAVGAALNGCPMAPPASFDEIQTTIFTPRCAIGTCHDAGSHTENLTLVEGLAYDQLVNVSSQEASLLRVKPGDPDNSFLLIKLLGPPPSQGSKMPLTGEPLTATQIQLLRDWILQGAQH